MIGTTKTCLEEDLQESSLAEKDLVVLVDTKLNTSQHRALAAKKANGVLGFPGRSDASRSREVILHRCSALVRPPLQQVHGNVTKTVNELESVTYEEKLRKLGLLSLQKRKLKGILSMCINT